MYDKKTKLHTARVSCNLCTLSLCWLTGSTAGFFPLPSLISPACQGFDWGCFRYCTLLTLMVAPCTFHSLKLKTQPGIFLELDWKQWGEIEHSRTDRQVQSFAYDTTKSRKPVAIKILRIWCCSARTSAKLTPYCLKTICAHIFSRVFIHTVQNSSLLAEGVWI